MICSNGKEKIPEETKGTKWMLEELKGATCLSSSSSVVCLFFQKNPIRKGDNVVS